MQSACFSSTILCDLKQVFMSTPAVTSRLNIPFTVTGRYQQQLGRKAPDPTCDPDPITLVLLVPLQEYVWMNLWVGGRSCVLGFKCSSKNLEILFPSKTLIEAAIQSKSFSLIFVEARKQALSNGNPYLLHSRGSCSARTTCLFVCFKKLDFPWKTMVQIKKKNIYKT